MSFSLVPSETLALVNSVCGLGFVSLANVGATKEASRAIVTHMARAKGFDEGKCCFHDVFPYKNGVLEIFFALPASNCP
jgi:hypothetical protein